MGQRLSFFDANCTVGPRQVHLPETRLTEEQILEIMDRCGIERALVTHSFAVEMDFREGNSRCTQLAERSERFVPSYVVIPHHTGEMQTGDALLAYLRNGGARAVRLFPKKHRYSLLPPWGYDLLSTLESAKVPVFIDADQIDFVELRDVLAKYSRLPVVLVRPWYRVDRFLYPLLERHLNLSIEISWYQPFRGLESLASRFGADRLLFGSGLPGFDPASTATAVRYTDLPWGDLEKIARRNLEKLLWE